MEDLKQKLLVLIDAYASAKFSDNNYLMAKMADEIKQFLESVEIAEKSE